MQIQILPVTVKDIAKATIVDPVLSRVYQYVLNGWHNEVSEDLKRFKQRSLELTVEENCILWGIQVIVPAKLQLLVLEDLRSSHPGIVVMKGLARNHVWWPKIDSDTVQVVQSCGPCQSVHENPSQVPVHPWAWPSRPWEQIHIDFAGSFQGSMFLIVINAHSEWLEVIPMSTTTTHRTIEELRDVFSRFGLPNHLVSDNEPPTDCNSVLGVFEIKWS